jgi:hypothetical protein
MTMTRIAGAAVCALTLLGVRSPALDAQDYSWPREITVTQGTIILYQPQPEGLVGNQLTARGAFALKPTGRVDPIFGAMWMTATVDVDRDSGQVWIHDLKVSRARWADATPEQLQRFTQIVETDFPAAGFHMTLERLTASLAAAESERSHVEGLKSDAPKIVFVEQLAVLLMYDGQPRMQAIENTNLEVVVNTPFGVVRDKTTGTYFLGGGKIWYSAPDPMGPWQAGATPPEAIASGMAPDTSSTPAPNPPPAIVTATQATELVVTDGPPRWKTTAEGKLLYVENTETPWIREAEGRDNYLLITGRWFRSTSLQGPWSFVRPDSLPAVFQEIPENSPIGGVRSSIAMTVEAQDAVLDLQIPQTTAIKRTEAKLEVTYDGDPRFEDIAGTQVSYATNTASQVLRVTGVYYACDNGVWFRSQSPRGPWVVADSIPTKEIDQIPPSSPVYNLTYVDIYASTPEVVYVGYTPGYVGAYPYYGVPVYGTGWVYPPYVGTVYYPRPVTYGMHMTYNPWTGWGVGMTWSSGFFTFGVTFGGYGGYYPPRGYYPPGGYRPVNCYNCTINTGGGRRDNVNIGNSAGGGDRRRPTASQRPANSNNLYNRPENRARVADRSTRETASRQVGDRTARGSNNVFADRDGNVHRRTQNGWETRDGNSWKSDRSGSASGRGGSARPSHGMERDWQARQRGSSRSMGGGYGGGRRGGGGGRRR